MRTRDLLKLVGHRQRLTYLSFSRKARYILGVLYGETFRSRRLGTLGLRVVEIGLTDRCQCRCDHCYAASGQIAGTPDGLTTEEVFGLLDQMARMRVMEVSFEGGEPLLRRDLVDLVRHARQRGILPKINTNGILLSDSLLSRLKEAGLAWVMVSLDSADPALHDRHRHFSGCFEMALGALRRCQRQGVPATIVTCVRRESISNGDMERTIHLARSLGVKAVRVLFPVQMGRLASGEVLTPEERQQVRMQCMDPLVVIESPCEDSPCMGGLTRLSIASNGDVTPCSMIPFPFGNVRRQSLREIWELMAPFAHSAKPTGQCPTNDSAFLASLLRDERIANGE